MSRYTFLWLTKKPSLRKATAYADNQNRDEDGGWTTYEIPEVLPFLYAIVSEELGSGE
ncbi:hypothetical protein PPM_0275 [Paenibacillus polymyxa M1]|nr:hypothetical protein PPM_0275 [Paenibacillus polymyxa M1]